MTCIDRKAREAELTHLQELLKDVNSRIVMHGETLRCITIRYQETKRDHEDLEGQRSKLEYWIRDLRKALKASG